MEVKRYQSAQEFLDATKRFRAQDPVRTGLISSIVSSVANGSRTYEDYFWWTAIDGNEVQGLAIRTVPYGYVFSPMAEIAINAIYSTIKINDTAAIEFAGPRVVIDYLASLSKSNITEEESELIYMNTHLIPVPFAGAVRTGTGDDFEMILNWMKEFMKETGLRTFNLEEIVSSALNAGRYSIMEVDGAPVCLGGNSDIQDFEGVSIGRVGPIYTPKEHRKKGYASALTSHITAKLQEQGAIATLYTQADNPTSNKIYQEIGYVLVEENRRIVLS